MSRDQSDRVALAVDYPAHQTITMNGKLGAQGAKLDTFYRNCIASGSIVPPTGESRNVRRQDWIVGCVVCLFVVAGIAAFLIGLLWRH